MHNEQAKKVLERLQENRLAVSPDKCLWQLQKVEFLGYIIGRNRIHMSPEKVEVVLSWKRPASLADVESFLGCVSQIYRDRLGVTTDAAITLATLWLLLVSATTIFVLSV